MMRNGIVFPLPPLVLLTAETGYGLWPTPRANENDQGRTNAEAWAAAGSSWKGQGRGATLSTAVQLWPTPRARMTGAATPERVTDQNRNLEVAVAREMFPTPRATDGTHGGRVTERKGREGGNLIEAISARMFPTPAARDYRSPNAEPYSERGGGTKGEQLPNNAVGGQLNPTWVEWLMGFPAGWTDCGVSEIRLCRRLLS